MAVYYLELRCDDVTLSAAKKIRNEMMEKMRVYCANMQYTMNPSVVYRSDKGSKYPRHYAWEAEFLDDRRRCKERARKFTRCCLFYRLGEEPQDAKEILPCPDTDMEWEEKKNMEE